MVVKIQTEAYNSPQISIIAIEDVITTSDIEAGVETTPVPERGGSWETL